MYIYWDSAIVRSQFLPTQITKLEAMINFETCIELKEIFCKRTNEQCDALIPKVSLFCISLTVECARILPKTMFNYFSTNYNYQRLNQVNQEDMPRIVQEPRFVHTVGLDNWKERARMQKINKMYFKFEKQGWFEEFE